VAELDIVPLRPNCHALRHAERDGTPLHAFPIYFVP